MVKIDDINKLNPDLLTKSAAQLEREITERQMALAEISKREAEAKRAALLGEAGDKIDQLLEAVHWLNNNGFLNEKVKAVFTTTSGVFSPHLTMRKPK